MLLLLLERQQYKQRSVGHKYVCYEMIWIHREIPCVVSPVVTRGSHLGSDPGVPCLQAQQHGKGGWTLEE